MHRSKFSLKDYAINSTYDAVNLARVKDDLYNYDTFNRNYEGYMDYWCNLLWDESEPQCLKLTLSVTNFVHANLFAACMALL